jgi:beta-fructofuranosidase
VGQGFGQLEVMHTAVVDGQPFLVFSCLDADLSAGHRAAGAIGGTWAAKGDSVLGPWDLAGAQLLADRSLYVGRLIRLRDRDEWAFMAFVHEDPAGRFVGGITDPRPVRLVDGGLVIG